MRVNMDSSINDEPRFKILSRSLGIPFLHGVGCCWAVWLACYHSRSERLSKLEANASADLDGFADALISVGLADAEGAEHLRIHGVRERIKFLKQQQARGRVGGNNRAKARKAQEVTESSERLADAKQTLPQNNATAQAYPLAPAPALALTPTLAPALESKSKTRTFQKPTVEQVKEYCTERGNAVDPERFVDFYESKGWKVGSEPMKDWKACVRTWEKNGQHSSNGMKLADAKKAEFDRVMDNFGKDK